MTSLGEDPLVGRTIGQYQILARIGGGGMGVVYTARGTKLGRIVALKFLPPQWSHDETAKLRFVREAQAASATNHPNICTIHDIDTADDGQLFIVMAYYQGDTLKTRLESGALPIDEALDVATQIADGLAKAHAQGVVHRDIKPGNLILTEEGVRILDFGLATFADAAKLTAENSAVGTFAYMAPEQVRGLQADARSDVWAAGVVLYEMLTGHPPFRGSHAEAIGYAVRNESPTPIRAERPDVPEDVEQLVFRALHKDASVRYQSGRELARALRQVRGLSVPPDLKTQAIPIPSRPHMSRVRSTWRAAAVGLVLIAATTWAMWPTERVVVAIVPVVNQTGYAELDPVRMGLTYALTSALSDSRVIRLVGHDQLAALLQGVRAKGEDISSGVALQAIATGSDAAVLVIVTFQHRDEGSGFRARATFLRADTMASDGPALETPFEPSVLAKKTAYDLLPAVVEGIESHFRVQGPRRASIASFVRRTIGLESPRRPVAATVDTAVRLEAGVDAYEEGEYVSALQHFSAAAQQDPLRPLPVAWQSRVARVMRHDVEAEQFARQSLALLSSETPTRDRLFVEAIAAESRQDLAEATKRYAALKDRYPDDPVAMLELAAFLDRQGSLEDAITMYHDALTRDSHLLRPHLELCRLYNRVNQPINARESGRRAAERYGANGSIGRQAQALFCLTDSLRVGDDGERDEAIRQATAALQLVERGTYAYNLPRAMNYLALAFEAKGRVEDAATMWERSLAAARTAGNTVLEPLVLMNLGATNEKLGRRPEAIAYLRQSSRGFESLGDQARAAENLFNIGAILIEYAGPPDEGIRNVQDALDVFRQRGNRNFEVRAAEVMSTHHRYAGRYGDAERELNRAVSLAKERNLDTRSATTAIRLAQIHLDRGEYGRALRVLADALPNAAIRSQLEAKLYLARAQVRIGASDAARQTLESVRQVLDTQPDARLRPLLHIVQGELAYAEGRLMEARAAFVASAAFVTSDLPDIDALEARAYVGWFDSLQGHDHTGRALIAESLAIAHRVGHLSLEARCRLLLARIELSGRRYRQALDELAAIPRDDESRSIERELRVQVLHSSAQAWMGLGDAARASADQASARNMLRELARGLDEPQRTSFLARRDIREILE